MRHIPLLLALSAIALLVPSAHAREHEDLREKVRDAVQRTDRDLGNLINRDKLNDQQRDKFDAAVKDLHALGEAVAAGKWEGERARLERAADNLDYVTKNAALPDGDRQQLGIDVYTLRVTLDSWQQP
jgi:hypothetical protein